MGKSKSYFKNVEDQLSSSRKAMGQGWVHWDNAKVKTCAAKTPRGGVYQRLDKLRAEKLRKAMNDTMMAVARSYGLPTSLISPMMQYL